VNLPAEYKDKTAWIAIYKPGALKVSNII